MSSQQGDGDAKVSLWFPFSKEEAGFGLGVIGFVLTVLALYEVDKDTQIAVALGVIIVAYLAGLLVHRLRNEDRFDFIKDGGVSGLGYVPYFKKAKKSLLLTHVDDDRPGAELNGIYQQLLRSGVTMRRIIFLRDEAPEQAYTWIADFGTHENLSYVYVPPWESASMKFSFVVVDEQLVIVSVPGYDMHDLGQYCNKFILRHVFVIKDSEAAKVFSRMHADLWSTAKPLTNLDVMRKPKAFLEKIRKEHELLSRKHQASDI